MFKVDDRVYYTSGRHSSHQSNPLVGTTWECCGTVRTSERIHVSVLWDNGTSNAYLARDLTHAADMDTDKTNPNMVFLRRKIRRNYG